MRLGVVTTSYPRHLGEPAGSFVSGLNDWLRGQGHSVEVLAAGSADDDDSWQGHRVERIPARPGLFYNGGAPDALSRPGGNVAAALFSARMTLAVRRRARACDALISHWLLPCALACRLAAPGKPLWAIAHGGDVHLLRKLGLSSAVARLLDRPGVHLNFVSRAGRDRFAEAAGRAGRDLVARAGVCAMGIDLPRLQALAGARARSATSGPLHLVFLGRLVAIKGVDLLLAALAGIDAPYTLSIAGAGPEEAALRAQAERLGIQVHWRGELRADARDRLLAEADVVVVPSRIDGGRDEGMPLVALEALAAGAQLIVARSGGLAEIPESICFPVPMDDVGALRAALLEVTAGRRAAYLPGHWLEEQGWDRAAPRLLPGLRV